MQNDISQVNKLQQASSPNNFINKDIVTANNQVSNTGDVKRLSIIIPAYNEEKTIAKILDRINEVILLRNIEKEVIVVNDCSKDNTEAAIHNYLNITPNLTINYFKYIKHEVNQGKGAAIHTGIVMATGDYLLV